MTDGDSLLAAIRLKPDDIACRLAYVDWAHENIEYTLRAIAETVGRFGLLRLTANGFESGLFNRGLTIEQSEERFRREREYLLSMATGFVLSVAWLADKQTRKTIDTGRNSYGYKHDVERFFNGYVPDHYVANGQFIAAAVWRGFGFHRYLDGYSASFNMRRSKRPRQTRSIL